MLLRGWRGLPAPHGARIWVEGLQGIHRTEHLFVKDVYGSYRTWAWCRSQSNCP